MRRVWLAIALVFWATTAWAADIAVGNTSYADRLNNQVATISWNHTVGAGADRVLVVVASTYANANATIGNITNITFNNVALTQAVEKSYAPANTWAEAWYLINPPTGNYVINVTASGIMPAVNSFCAAAIDFTGANQTAQPDASAGNTTSGTQYPNATLTTNYNNSIPISIIQSNNYKMNGQGTNQTLIASMSTDYIRTSYSGKVSPAGIVNHTYNGNTGADDFCWAIIAIRENTSTNTTTASYMRVISIQGN